MKKIAIFINIIPSFPAEKMGIITSQMGGWLMSMINGLIEYSKNDVNFDIISPYNNTDKLLKFNDGKLNYFLIPSSKNKVFWKEYIEKYSPNIIHINGTETDIADPIFELNYEGKIIISIQGLINEISKNFYGGLHTKEIIANITLKDLFRGSTLPQRKRNMIKKIKSEENKLINSDVIIGRTKWDYSYINKLGLTSKYITCNESLREAFYSDVKWDVEKCTPYTIFCSQGAIPYKGIHVLINSLKIVKMYFPEVQLRVAGYNIINKKTIRDRLLISSYGKYIDKLIKKNKLEENIKFIGNLDQIGIYNELINSNVFVQTSYIENSPNSLAEAIMLDVPVIATLVGGTEQYISHNFNGYLYDYKDENILAYYIMNIFRDKSLAKKFSKNHQQSKAFFDRKTNAETLYNIYKTTLES